MIGPVTGTGTQTPAAVRAAPGPPGFWWRVLSPPGAVVLAFVVLVVASLVLYAFLGDEAAGTLAVTIGSLAIVLFGLALRSRLPAHEQRLTTALKHSRTGAVLMGMNVGLGLVITSVVIILLGTLVDPGLADRLEQEPVDIGPGVWGAVLTVFSLVVLAPLGEELLFRGLLLRGLVRRLRFWWSALITSAVFATAHIDAWIDANWARGIALLAVGMGLAWLYRWRGYWAAVVAHATVNGVAAIALIAQQ